MHTLPSSIQGPFEGCFSSYAVCVKQMQKAFETQSPSDQATIIGRIESVFSATASTNSSMATESAHLKNLRLFKDLSTNSTDPNFKKRVGSIYQGTIVEMLMLLNKFPLRFKEEVMTRCALAGREPYEDLTLLFNTIRQVSTDLVETNNPRDKLAGFSPMAQEQISFAMSTKNWTFEQAVGQFRQDLTIPQDPNPMTEEPLEQKNPTPPLLQRTSSFNPSKQSSGFPPPLQKIKKSAPNRSNLFNSSLEDVSSPSRKKDQDPTKNEGLAEIFQETLRLIPKKVNQSRHKRMLEGVSRTTGFLHPTISVRPQESPTKIVVKGLTSFAMTREVLGQGYKKPLLLDMANAYTHGGGVLHGARAQEETLCRQSNLYPALEEANEKGFYPLPEYGGLLIPEVQFFRDDNYQQLSEPLTVDVFVSAAYNCKEGRDKPIDNATYEEGTKKKIRTMLRMGLLSRYDALILSAFGCGAFKNDPTFIAQTYHDILNEKEFKNKFALVAFGIYDAPDSPNQKSLPIFKQILDSSSRLPNFQKTTNSLPVSSPTKIKPAKKSPNDLLFDFYRGKGPDNKGRYFKEILAWDDARLEKEHDYIQWLFPNWGQSKNNPEAPVLKNAPGLADKIKTDPACQKNLDLALVRMKKFYGLTDSSTKERTWVTRTNHNLARITRILNCLNWFTGAWFAHDFFLLLQERLTKDERGTISADTWVLWSEACRERV